MFRPQPAAAGRQLPRGHLLVLNPSFRRTLEAENKSPRTIEAYTDTVRLLATHCQAHGRPLLAGELRRQHLQDFIADQLAPCKPATAHTTTTAACAPSSSGRWPRATWRPARWRA
jgi:Phage integrase, N-terminal SAM-like domain